MENMHHRANKAGEPPSSFADECCHRRGELLVILDSSQFLIQVIEKIVRHAHLFIPAGSFGCQIHLTWISLECVKESGAA